MSLEEFFSQLRITLTKPTYTPIINHEMLRIKDERGETYCPITVVVHDLFGVYFLPREWNEAANLLNLYYMDASDLAFAADYKAHPLRSELIDTIWPQQTDHSNL